MECLVSVDVEKACLRVDARLCLAVFWPAVLLTSASALADDCADAASVKVNTVIPFDTTNASPSGVVVDPGACPGSFFTGIGPDLWFRLSLQSPGRLWISTCDPEGFDTDLSLHVGDCRSLATIACNGDVPDEPGCQPRHSVIDVEVDAAADHFIRVGGFNGNVGTGHLAIEFEPACPGDIDGDGRVGGADLGLLFLEWGACSGCSGDIDADGRVGGGDLGLLFLAWGDCG